MEAIQIVAMAAPLAGLLAGLAMRMAWYDREVSSYKEVDQGLRVRDLDGKTVKMEYETLFLFVTQARWIAEACEMKLPQNIWIDFFGDSRRMPSTYRSRKRWPWSKREDIVHVWARHDPQWFNTLAHELAHMAAMETFGNADPDPLEPRADLMQLSLKKSAENGLILWDPEFTRIGLEKIKAEEEEKRRKRAPR